MSSDRTAVVETVVSQVVTRSGGSRQVTGPVFWVAPNGNDSASGSEADPWRTIQHGASTVPPGATLYVRSGVYHELVNVEVSGSDGQRQTEAHDVPLVGVSCDAPARDRVDIMVGAHPRSHVTHIVEPIDVALETTDAGAERGLRIRAADGSTTTVEFRSPMRPEDVDGMPSR